MATLTLIIFFPHWLLIYITSHHLTPYTNDIFHSSENTSNKLATASNYYLSNLSIHKDISLQKIEKTANLKLTVPNLRAIPITKN